MNSLIDSVLGVVSPYFNIIKYGALAIVVSVVLYKVYDFYDYYNGLKTSNITLTASLKAANEDLERVTKIANDNSNTLKEERKSFENTIGIITANHKEELENAKKFASIRGKIQNEENGPIAPVLTNTINRLFSKK